MAGPYYTADKGGVVKLTDTAKYLSGDGTKPGDKPSDAEARGAGGLPGVSGGVGNSPSDKDKPSPTIPPAIVEKAKQGDPDALKYLEGLGITVGTVGGAYALYRMLKGRKGNPAAEDIITPDAETGTYLVPKDPKVTQLKDEQIIPRTRRAGYLQGPGGSAVETGSPPPLTGPRTALPAPTPTPANDEAARFAPYYQQRRDRATAADAAQEATAGLQHQDFYAARRAKMQAIAKALGRVVK